MALNMTPAEPQVRRDPVPARARRRRELLRLGGGGVVAGVLLGGGGAAAGARLAGGMAAPRAAVPPPAIVGAWYVIRATPATPAPGTAPLTHWTMLFMADGTLLAQVAPVGLSLAGVTTVGSVASGVWGPLAAGQFGFTHLHVRSDAQTGAAYGLPRAFGTITLDPGGDTFAIAYRQDLLNLETLAVDQQGEPLAGKGRRIALDPRLHAVMGQPLQ